MNDEYWIITTLRGGTYTTKTLCIHPADWLADFGSFDTTIVFSQKITKEQCDKLDALSLKRRRP